MANYFANADTGNDTTGAGTAVSPWLTINKLLSASTTNDTLNLQAATAVYSWTGTSNSFGSRNFVGAGPSASRIDHGSAAFLYNPSLTGGTYNFSNLTFQNAAPSSTFGVYMQITANNVTVNYTNCVWNNIVCGTGFLSANGTNNVVNMTACLLYNVSSSLSFGDALFETALVNSSMTNCTVYSNVITANVMHILDVSTANVVLKNNIFYTVNAQTFAVGTPTLTGSANNCIIGYTSIPTMTGTITSDPLFVDVSSLNFNLRPTSPCIDAGVII